jgi:hypothetical protein
MVARSFLLLLSCGYACPYFLLNLCMYILFSVMSIFSQNPLRINDSLRHARQNIPTMVERWIIFVLLRFSEWKNNRGIGEYENYCMFLYITKYIK